jgi:uncharacterized protein (DUF927 family)
MKDEVSTEKLRKIEALCQRGHTDGERQAAAAALERVKSHRPLRITRTIINIDRQEAFYEVQHRDVHGQQQKLNLARELFLHRSKVVERLLKVGAALPDDQAAAVEIVKKAIESKSQDTLRITERAGWYEDETFVYPNETFGKLAGQIVYQAPHDLDPAFGLRAGSLEEWREGLRQPCRHSDYLIIAIGQKASNALLELIGEDESCVLHHHGVESAGAEKAASSSGKTLLTMVAASMTGRCHRNDLITFGLTEAGLCDLCYARNNVGIELDEEGRALGSGTGPRVKSDELSYLVTSGRGGVRSNYATRRAELKNRTWLSNAITSGETLLDANSKRQARTEGSQVRMIGVPVPPGAKGGIFNRVNEHGKKRAERCKQLAAQTEATIAANYGVAFPSLLMAITPMHRTLGAQITKQIDEFISDVGADINPWERRFARKLAIAGATAVLLSDLGIAPWTKRRAIRALRHLYRKTRSAVSTVDELAVRVTDRVRQMLSDRCFPKLRKGKMLSPRALACAKNGFRKELSGVGQVLLMPPANVAKLIGRRGIFGLVIQRLADQGIVHLGGDGKPTREILVKGLAEGRHRYVCFDVAALKAGGK